MVVLRCDEDGGKHIRVLPKEKVLEMLNSGELGVIAAFEEIEQLGGLDYFVGTVLIDGDIITPTPVEVTTRYEL